MNPKPKLKILVLEDCEEDMYFLTRKLERSGYDAELEHVWSEKAAREALHRRAWDIIISDCTLPGFDGLQALALVKGLGLSTPFILLTGLLTEEKESAARKAGALDCIPKNNLDMLLPAIERALRSEKNENPVEGKKLPPTGVPVIARCHGFRCLAYLDSDGKWREHQNSKELPEVIEWFDV
ncbi:MAG TPA: response regulator [Verrucomicrobiae bacterium]|jgi:CheY-like chemotaxis protein